MFCLYHVCYMLYMSVLKTMYVWNKMCSVVLLKRYITWLNLAVVTFIILMFFVCLCFQYLWLYLNDVQDLFPIIYPSVLLGKRVFHTSSKWYFFTLCQMRSDVHDWSVFHGNSIVFARWEGNVYGCKCRLVFS